MNCKCHFSDYTSLQKYSLCCGITPFFAPSLIKKLTIFALMTNFPTCSNQLINNHGGLHNRVTERIKIYPFNLRETELLLQSNNNVLDRYQILQLYMVMGGVPFYLDAVSPEKSAAQNIEELCFRKGALLTTEFQNLFASLFRACWGFNN